MFHQGDCMDIIPALNEDPSIEITLVIADPPYDDLRLVNRSIDLCRKVCKGMSIFFMYPEDIQELTHKPEQVVHWMKPTSTKNTFKRYSRFVEAIVLYDVVMSDRLHWSQRTGVFMDRVDTTNTHPYRKPLSLIMTLLGNHYPGFGYVLDPFAGSRCVEEACSYLGIPCISIDKVDYGKSSKTVSRDVRLPSWASSLQPKE